jgi:benzoyl-CoA reductase/2-hydroxyglutaryl-CoA dehydratase subunit BcrC/BadD/HgdB
MTDAQFDERYRLPPHRVDNPGVRKRARFVESEQRRVQEGIRSRPADIAWFEERLAVPAPDGNRKLVGYFCNMIPVELIQALGAVPVRLGCGNPAMVQPGEEVFSGEICPLAKASFAAFLDADSLASRCDLLLLPARCDAKRKLGEVLADFRPTFTLNLPPEQDASRFGDFAAGELERMTEFLEEHLGARLSTGRLLAEIEAANRRTLLVRRLQEARAAKPAALSVRDLFLTVQSSFAATTDPEEWLARAGAVLEHVERFDASRPRIRPRLVLTGAPIIWPNFKPLNLLEESGADVVADTLCSGAQALFDPVVFSEKSRSALMRALAARYVFGSPCPCFISQGTRLSRVLDLVKELKADGVVNYSLRLCQLFDIEAYRLSRVLKQRRVPFMIMRTDYSLEDTEQLRVRLEAFLETLGE